MRGGVAVLLLAALGGCSSVKVVQRDGCWVRQTSKLFSAREEIGPCARPEPRWSEDRITRVVQECAAQADYRWLGRALDAWSRGQPLPERPSSDAVLGDCMEQASRSQLAENERLHERLTQLSDDRAALEKRAQEDRARMLAGFEKMAGDLGAAARRPSPPAVATATATSEGKSSSDGRSTSERSGEGKALGTPVAAPAPAPSRASAPPAPASCPPVSCPPAAAVTPTAAPR